MSRHISASPQFGSFAPGYEPPPSDLENLVSGRENELGNRIDQAVFQRFVSGEVQLTPPTRFEQGVGQFGTFSQNALSALLLSQGGLKVRD